MSKLAKTEKPKLTHEQKIRQQLFELPIENIIKAIRTGIIEVFDLQCNYCVYKGECYKLGAPEYCCGAGIREYLKGEVK